MGGEDLEGPAGGDRLDFQGAMGLSEWAVKLLFEGYGVEVTYG